MSIDNIMTVISLALLGIMIPSVISMIKQINKKRIGLKDLQMNYLNAVNFMSNQNVESMSKYELDTFINVFKEVYKKMLQDKNSENDSIKIILRKYIEESNEYITIYTSPVNCPTPLMLSKVESCGDIGIKTYVYINGESPYDKSFHAEWYNGNFGTSIYYTLREQNKNIGAICILSESKINEKYRNYDINPLIENIENVLIRYIKSS